MAKSDEKAALSRGARRRARYREIAAVLWDERVLNVFKGAGLDEHAPPEAARREGDPGVKEKELPRAVRIRHALERLGPAFIKAGQILATRRDLVPPDLAEELAKLQDDVPTLPWEDIKARIEAELGHPVEELFATFDAEPIAAASIGQVYRATLPDGTLVAVKVQRPGVTETMDIDLEILIDQAHRLAVHTQWGKDFDVASLAEEFASILRSELDYRHEGHALDRFREAFADDKNVLFPAVYWDHSSQSRAHHGLHRRRAGHQARGRAGGRGQRRAARRGRRRLLLPADLRDGLLPRRPARREPLRHARRARRLCRLRTHGEHLAAQPRRRLRHAPRGVRRRPCAGRRRRCSRCAACRRTPTSPGSRWSSGRSWPRTAAPRRSAAVSTTSSRSS